MTSETEFQSKTRQQSNPHVPQKNGANVTSSFLDQQGPLAAARKTAAELAEAGAVLDRLRGESELAQQRQRILLGEGREGRSLQNATAEKPHNAFSPASRAKRQQGNTEREASENRSMLRLADTADQLTDAGRGAVLWRMNAWRVVLTVAKGSVAGERGGRENGMGHGASR